MNPDSVTRWRACALSFALLAACASSMVDTGPGDAGDVPPPDSGEPDAAFVPDAGCVAGQADFQVFENLSRGKSSLRQGQTLTGQFKYRNAGCLSLTVQRLLSWRFAGPAARTTTWRRSSPTASSWAGKSSLSRPAYSSPWMRRLAPGGPGAPGRTAPGLGTGGQIRPSRSRPRRRPMPVRRILEALPERRQSSGRGLRRHPARRLLREARRWTVDARLSRRVQRHRRSNTVLGQR